MLAEIERRKEMYNTVMTILGHNFNSTDIERDYHLVQVCKRLIEQGKKVNVYAQAQQVIKTSPLENFVLADAIVMGRVIA